MSTLSTWSRQLKEFVAGWPPPNAPSREGYWGDEPFDRFVVTDVAESWSDCIAWLDSLEGRWFFRGQRESSWSVHTSLDRAVRVDVSWPNSSGYYHRDRETEQRELFAHFRRYADVEFNPLPPLQDFSSWLALMQHAGEPTRLLDWTTSPHVALYFAFVNEPQEPSAALWAIDSHWLLTRGRALLGTDEDENVLIRYVDKPVIIQIHPVVLNARMTAQHGILLCKLFHQAMFSQILMSMVVHPEVPEQPVIRRLAITRTLRPQILQSLKAMDIHRGTLFPGNDEAGRLVRRGLQRKVERIAARESHIELGQRRRVNQIQVNP